MSFAQVLGSLWPGTGTGEDSLATGTASDPVLMSVHLCLFVIFAGPSCVWRDSAAGTCTADTTCVWTSVTCWLCLPLMKVSYLEMSETLSFENSCQWAPEWGNSQGVKLISLSTELTAAWVDLFF